MRDKKTLNKKTIIVLILSLLIMVIMLFVSGQANPIIQLEDPGLESAIREKLDRARGPIYQTDLNTITELDASNKGITSLHGIERFTKLVNLNLENNKIDDLSPLQSLLKLRSLNLNNNGIIDLNELNFVALENIPLEQLSLRHNVSNKERLSDISTLESMVSLTKLDLRDNHVTDLTALGNLTNLVDLDLRENKFIDIEVLSNLTKLEELNLRENNIDSIEPISNLLNLKYLNIHSNTKIQSLGPISDLVNLETLIMRDVSIENQIDVLEHLTKLQRINVLDTGIENEDTKELFSNLRSQGALKGEVRPITLIHTINPPTSSHSAGFYEKGFNLELSSEAENGAIYYTLDNSEPTKNSFRYLMGNPIVIEENQEDATVIRFKIITDDDNISETITNTYFIDKKINERYDLPVISLVTDNKNLFDENIGIYTEENAFKSGADWERPIHIEFFENGSRGFFQNAGVRIHGGITRRRDQKSLRLYADSEYDNQQVFKYELFEGLKVNTSEEDVNEFKTILLRNSGNDWGNTMFRDALLQSLVEPLGTMDTQAHQPSIVFVNGHYWGIHNIRQRFDEYYLKYAYDVSEDDVVILEGNGLVDVGKDDDAKHYQDMLKYINFNRLTDQKHYGYIQTMMDVENYRDYVISQTFFGNIDWPHNNIRYWRLRTDEYMEGVQIGHDGRWRWMLFDTDFGFGISPETEDRYGSQRDYSHNTISWVMSEYDGWAGNKTWPNFLIRSLMENETFKLDFLVRYNDLLNTNFEPNIVIEKIDALQRLIEQEMEYHINRWGRPDSMEQWYNNVDVMRTFAIERPAYIRQHLINEFNLEGTIDVNVDVSSNDKGYVKLNTLDIKDSWSGIYFKEIPISISAVSNPGYEFSHWEGLDLEDSSIVSITVSPKVDISLRAVFIKSN